MNASANAELKFLLSHIDQLFAAFRECERRAAPKEIARLMEKVASVRLDASDAMDLMDAISDEFREAKPDERHALKKEHDLARARLSKANERAAELEREIRAQQRLLGGSR